MWIEEIFEEYQMSNKVLEVVLSYYSFKTLYFFC